MKRSNFHIILLGLCLLAGCHPHNILSRRQMISVLTDLHKAEATISAAGYSYGHEEAVGKCYYVVLEKHGITQAQFDSSLVWYTKHPERFDKIYPKVVARLESDLKKWEEEHPTMVEKAPSRQLPDLDRLLYQMRHGLLLDYWDIGENYKKMQKSEEKFVYIKIIL